MVKKRYGFPRNDQERIFHVMFAEISNGGITERNYDQRKIKT